MSVTSGFFNSLNGDRRYDARQFSALFDGIINDGVFANIGNSFKVTAAGGLQINIGLGRAWFNSTWVNNDAILPFTLDDSDQVLNRYDAVIIEVNTTNAVRKGDIKIIKGVAATNPALPTLMKADGVYQYPLAYIFREASSTSVNQASITNKIGTSDCPYVTGILQVQSIDNIISQWESQWIQWYSDITADGAEDIHDSIISMQTEFRTWFEALQAELSGDVAANLAASILELEMKFQNIEQEGCIYDDLKDSNGDLIMDSNGTAVVARVVIGSAGGSSTTTDAVKYTLQVLTEAEKQQARANIGASGLDVLKTTSQVLTEAEKQQVRNNIEAVSQAELSSEMSGVENSIATVRTGVSTNTKNIATNTTNIAKNASDISNLQGNSMPIAGGTFTGGVTVNGRLTAQGTIVLSSTSYGSNFPSSPVTGQLFFKRS